MKKAVNLIVVMALSALLATCQPTPQEDDVVGKGKGELEQKIMQTAGTTALDSPDETWQEKLEYQSEVQVVIDPKSKLRIRALIQSLKPHRMSLQQKKRKSMWIY